MPRKGVIATILSWEMMLYILNNWKLKQLVNDVQHGVDPSSNVIEAMKICAVRTSSGIPTRQKHNKLYNKITTHLRFSLNFIVLYILICKRIGSQILLSISIKMLIHAQVIIVILTILNEELWEISLIFPLTMWPSASSSWTQAPWELNMNTDSWTLT